MVIRALLSESGLPRLDGEVLLAHVLGIPREKLLFQNALLYIIPLETSIAFMLKLNVKLWPLTRNYIRTEVFYGIRKKSYR